MPVPEDEVGGLSRRQFLKTGFAGSLLLAGGSATALLAGCASQTAAPGFAFLRPQDVAVVRALIPVVLADAVPAGDTQAIERVLKSADDFIAGTSPAAMDQLKQLFDLLSLAPARVALCGLWDDWPQASAGDLDAFLLRWRDSRLDLLRAGYLGLVKIITASWYLLPESWVAIGYEAPIHVV